MFVCLIVFNATFNNISVISWGNKTLEEREQCEFFFLVAVYPCYLVKLVKK